MDHVRVEIPQHGDSPTSSTGSPNRKKKSKKSKKHRKEGKGRRATAGEECSF
jgi:hypothetical protein